MFLELVKFRRPYSIAISNSGIVACLIRPTTSKLVVIPPSGKNNILSININTIGLKGAQSLAKFTEIDRYRFKNDGIGMATNNVRRRRQA